MTIQPRRTTRVDAVRLLLGFAILPAADALLAFLIHRAVWRAGPYEGALWGDPVDAAVAFAAGVTIIAVIVTLAGAIPVVCWLRSKGPLSLKQMIIAGAALGNAPYAISVAAVALLYLVGVTTAAAVGHVLTGPPMGFLRAVVIGSAVGIASGLVFWAVAIRGTGFGRHAVASGSDPTPIASRGRATPAS